MANCSGYKHEPSLYLRVCCIISNLGQTVTIRGISKTRYILCPNVQPKSCLKGTVTAIIVEVFNSYIIDDCKSLFEDGFDVSGVYTVNPDGGIPFEVS